MLFKCQGPERTKEDRIVPVGAGGGDATIECTVGVWVLDQKGGAVRTVEGLQLEALTSGSDRAAFGRLAEGVLWLIA